MESFDRFRKTLLDNLNSELDEYKKELEAVEDTILKNNIEKEKTKKKILELKKNSDGTHDIFSPAAQVENFNSIEIEKLTEKITGIEEKLSSCLKNRESLQNKIKTKEDIADMVDKFKLSNEKKSNINTMEIYLDKLKFCSKICISDSNRCKIELDNIMKNLINDINVSRETSET